MHARSSLFASTVLCAVLAVAGCAASPSSAQPPSSAQASSPARTPSVAIPEGVLTFDLARHDASSTHFEGRTRRSELIDRDRAAEVAVGDSLSIMGGEDGVWKDPVVGASAMLRFTFGGGPREGALDLSMDTGPNNTVSFSVDNRLGRDILLSPFILKRDLSGGARLIPGRPCRLGAGIIFGESVPPGVFAVIIPAHRGPVEPGAAPCERDHDMFIG